jgi:hypothetical protein
VTRLTARYALALGLLALPATGLAQAAPAPQEPAAAARLPDAFSDETPTAVLEAEQARIARAETALRVQIAGLQAGTPAYDAMTPGLAEAVRPQAAQVVQIINSLGALQAIRHVGVENGAELFLVTFAAAPTQWIVGLDEEGHVGALLFRPAT